MRYYPPYARGMAYALSEDVVIPLGTALFDGRLEPFPYREDVSVGLYILELAKRGEAWTMGDPFSEQDNPPVVGLKPWKGLDDLG